MALHATDPLSMIGLAGHLADRQEIELLPGDLHQHADVVVVATGRLSVELAASMKRSTADLAAPVVVVAGDLDEAELAAAAECRVVAVLPEAGLTSERLVACVITVASRGDAPLSGPPRDQPTDADTTTQALTPREEQVLRLMADGLVTAEIAERLSYSERTVKNVLYGVTSRLDLRSRPHAVAYALRRGLI